MFANSLKQLKENAESARFHRNALQKLVCDRGGLETLREQNEDLGRILQENDFVDSES